MNESKDLRLEKLSLLIGTMLGHISELLNRIKVNDLCQFDIYQSLLDINKIASLQVHELHYKDLDKKDIDRNE